MRIWADEGNEKTKPIYSYRVMRDAYCEKNFKKQSQFMKGQNGAMSAISMVYGDFDR
jgi:hypothetical protein